MTTESESKFIKIIQDQAAQISMLIVVVKALTDIVEAQTVEIERLKITKNA